MIEFLTEEEYRNSDQTDYVQLQKNIDEKYPKGWFVALHDGKVVADGETFEAVDGKIRGLGLDVQSVSVIQSGDDNSFLWIL